MKDKMQEQRLSINDHINVTIKIRDDKGMNSSMTVVKQLIMIKMLSVM